jgi:hypothetical protein
MPFFRNEHAIGSTDDTENLGALVSAETASADFSSDSVEHVSPSLRTEEAPTDSQLSTLRAQVAALRQQLRSTGSFRVRFSSTRVGHVARSPNRPTAEEAPADGSRLSALRAQVAALSEQLRSGSGFRVWRPDIFYYLFAVVAGTLFALSINDSRNRSWGILLAGFSLALLCSIPPRLKNRFRYWVQVDRPNHRLQRRIAPLVAKADCLKVAIVCDLESWVEPVTREDPESPLRWISKSVPDLTEELNRQGHAISHPIVTELLKGVGLQSASPVDLDQ